MVTDAVRFRVLLAEDDPVSREFLAETLRACGAEVTDCADGMRALELACAQRWDLLVLDHHLPGRNGDEVLAGLRSDPNAASRNAPAVATSATRESGMPALLRAGFSEVLGKPMRVEELHAALRRNGCEFDPPLDDDDALDACGSPETVARLRRLFVDRELPGVHDELIRTAGNLDALRPTLHRLHASCGFCGATTLARTSEALHSAIATGDEARVRSALRRFRSALAATSAALRADTERSAALR